ncbi:radical SAM protein [Luxibacter massiliensis]|uniref:radical SAM protein n=1 Tax=Luxibacter massiliensis TaxID=2219695 RepID=UPI000F056F3A|nr:radical SAM protein [Luxibacter massiliensis]
MEYEGQICRGPMERGSYMLPTAVGCSYNRCAFCVLFKHLKYRELPMGQIEEELKRVWRLGGSPKRVFLGDGNAFGSQMERLVEILSLIHQYFPECEEVNMDATVTNIQDKTDEELKLLQKLGVRHLYLGIEGGLDDVLCFMKKDHTLAQAYEQIGRLKTAGLLYDAHMMTGVAGKGRGIENAERTAEFFNRTRPLRIINFSMFLHKDAPLYPEIQAGNFVPADELENLREELRLIELLKAETFYDGFHDYIEFRVKGSLPIEKEKMLGKLQNMIVVYENKASVTAIV